MYHMGSITAERPLPPSERALLAAWDTPPSHRYRQMMTRLVQIMIAEDIYDYLKEYLVLLETNSGGLDWLGYKGIITSPAPSGSFVAEIGLGVTPLDPAAAWVDTGIPPGTMFTGTHQYTLLLWCTSNNPNSGGTNMELGCYSAGPAILGLRASSGIRAGAWPNTSTQHSFGGSISAGQTGISRSTSAGGFTHYQGGSTAYTIAALSALPTGNFTLYRNFPSSVASQSENRIGAAWWFDASISNAKIAIMAGLFEDCIKMMGQWDVVSPLLEDENETISPPHIFGNDAIDYVDPFTTVAIIANPPSSDAIDGDTFKNFPANMFCCRPQAMTGTWSEGKVFEFFWADRRNYDEFGNTYGKPNDTSGAFSLNQVVCRPEYSSIEKAIGATLVRGAWSCGFKFRDDTALTMLNGVSRPAGWGWGDIAEAYGYDVTAWDTLLATYGETDDRFVTDYDVATLTANPSYDGGEDPAIDNEPYLPGVVHRENAAADAADYFVHAPAQQQSFKVAHDVIILHQARQYDAPFAATDMGIFVDYEVSDDRSEAEFVETIQGLCEIAQAKGGRRVAIVNHALGGSAVNSGITRASLLSVSGVTGFDWFVVSADQTIADVDAYIAYLDGQLDVLTQSGTYPLDTTHLGVQISMGSSGSQLDATRGAALNDWCTDNDILVGLRISVGGKPGGDETRNYNIATAAALGIPLGSGYPPT